MAEKPAYKPTETPKTAKPAKQALDLNALSGLDFGPTWADENAKSGRPKNYDSFGGGSVGGASRDRRSSGRPNSGHSTGRDGQLDRRGQGASRGRSESRRGCRGEGGRGRSAAPAYFEPTIKVDLYPQDEAFEALINRLRSSARTYQLFDIAQLLLEKPERYIVVVSPKPVKGDDLTQLYYSVPGHLPFRTEEAAINHVMANHLDQFFEIEEIEVEPPKGNFQIVNRCTITNELLGPPNYHRYQEFLQLHYAARITGMSFDQFAARVESSKEEEDIDAWLESMKKGARYTVKDHQEGESESLETLEAVRNFLLQHRKNKVVGSGDSIRFAGRDIERLPKGDIRRSVEAYVESQKHFPLDSANNIRGRLRRHKFAVYKKGSKGVSFVCAVKRKFRDSKTVFTKSIGDLIDFIEKHPYLPASKLPNEYVGIDTEKQKPEALKMTEAEVEVVAKAKAKAAETEAQPADEFDSIEDGNVEASEKASDVDESTATISKEVSASTEAEAKAELSKEDQKKLRQLMLDLRWLITEGYVTEYGDGRLFAPPPMPDAKPKQPKASKVELNVESDLEAIAIEDVAEDTEFAKDVESLKIQASPETAVVETQEIELEAPSIEAKADECIDEKES
ncbi:MAG: hypothetical protein VXY17_00470 [Verrucomicrobiota bacterium]|nr:hypothetical protein [Verrucomicrobiota bacterium]